MLALLYLKPDQEQTMSQLVKNSGLSYDTVIRDVNALEGNGYLTTRTSGRNRYVKVNQQNPITPALTQVLLYTQGPVVLLGPILAEIPGIQEAMIYGSWARRYKGEPVAHVNDLDVLVVGDIKRADLFEPQQAAAAILRTEVNLTPLPTKVWSTSTDSFTLHLRENPLIPIPLMLPQQASEES
jgi:DNA-binding transcriptional ArsR family regulator